MNPLGWKKGDTKPQPSTQQPPHYQAMLAQQPQQYPLPKQVDKENMWDVYDYSLVMEEVAVDNMVPPEIVWNEPRLRMCENWVLTMIRQEMEDWALRTISWHHPHYVKIMTARDLATTVALQRYTDPISYEENCFSVNQAAPEDLKTEE